MIYCSSWYCSCSIVKYFVSSVVSILYCKFLSDDITKDSGFRQRINCVNPAVYLPFDNDPSVINQAVARIRQRPNDLYND